MDHAHHGGMQRRHQKWAPVASRGKDLYVAAPWHPHMLCPEASAERFGSLDAGARRPSYPTNLLPGRAAPTVGAAVNAPQRLALEVHRHAELRIGVAIAIRANLRNQRAIALQAVAAAIDAGDDGNLRVEDHLAGAIAVGDAAVVGGRAVVAATVIGGGDGGGRTSGCAREAQRRVHSPARQGSAQSSWGWLLVFAWRERSRAPYADIRQATILRVRRVVAPAAPARYLTSAYVAAVQAAVKRARVSED